MIAKGVSLFQRVKKVDQMESSGAGCTVELEGEG